MGDLVAPQHPEAPGTVPVSQIDHAGYAVPDLDEAISFFTALLGFEVVLTSPLVSDPEWLGGHLEVPVPGTERLALLRHPSGGQIELLEFSVPEQDTTPPRNSDAGGRHLALEVDDIAGATALLRATPGVRVVGEPAAVQTGLGASTTTLYFVAPWGMYLELICRTGAS